MEILEVYPKDWHVKVEFTLNQAVCLLEFLDRSIYENDVNDPNSQIIADYVIKDLFPKLNDLVEDMKKGAIDGT